MNCKGNQLAQIIAGRFRDRVIFITTIDTSHPLHFLYPPCWNCEGPSLQMPDGSGELVSIYDHLLRPFDNPGEEGVDEMVKLVPLPTPSEVTA